MIFLHCNIPLNKINILFNKSRFSVKVKLDSHNINNYKDFILNLSKLITIKYTGIISKFIESMPERFDSLGDNIDGGYRRYSKKRGNYNYDPPQGWIGIGLNINKYDTDKTWIGHNNSKGEWPVAYHGVRGPNTYDKACSIISSNLRAGKQQLYNDSVGNGVYLSPDIKVAEQFASIGLEDCKYYIVFMCRVNPLKIRNDNSHPPYWVLNGNDSEIRPYRILIKKKEKI